MQKLLLIVAALGASSSLAVAQTAPAPSQPTSAQKPKTVTKIVCKRVEEEQSTGSRLGSTSKICRKVEVPADSSAQKNSDSGPSNGR